MSKHYFVDNMETYDLIKERNELLRKILATKREVACLRGSFSHDLVILQEKLAEIEEELEDRDNE